MKRTVIVVAGILAAGLGAAALWPAPPAAAQTPDRAQQIMEMQLRSRAQRPEGAGMSGREADAIYDKYLGGGNGSDHRTGGAAAPAAAAAVPGQ